MNLHGLRLFHEVAKYGSVTKGAEALKISQPSVTAQIKKFEKDEGIQLIIAAGRGIQLTTLGEEVYQLSQQLFAVEEEISRLFQGAMKPKQELRLGGTYLTAHQLIPQWLKVFEARFPEYGIQLATLNTHDLLGALLEGQLDLVLSGPSHVNDSRLAHNRVYRDRLCFVVRPGLVSEEVVSLESLRNHKFIGREQMSFTQQSLENLYRSMGVGLPRFSLTYNNSHDALQAVLAGKGIHFCSHLMVKDELEKGRLIELGDTFPIQQHDIYLYTKNSELGQAGREFKKLIIRKASRIAQP